MFQIECFKQQTTNNKQQTTNNKQQTTNLLNLSNLKNLSNNSPPALPSLAFHAIRIVGFLIVVQIRLLLWHLE